MENTNLFLQNPVISVQSLGRPEITNFPGPFQWKNLIIDRTSPIQWLMRPVFSVIEQELTLKNLIPLNEPVIEYEEVVKYNSEEEIQTERSWFLLSASPLHYFLYRHLTPDNYQSIKHFVEGLQRLLARGADANIHVDVFKYIDPPALSESGKSISSSLYPLSTARLVHQAIPLL